MCSIHEQQHCRLVCRSTIVCINDSATLYLYATRATPHTVTLSHLIDVESRLNILIVFGGVSKVATPLDVLQCVQYSSGNIAAWYVDRQ